MYFHIFIEITVNLFQNNYELPVTPDNLYIDKRRAEELPCLGMSSWYWTEFLASDDEK